MGLKLLIRSIREENTCRHEALIILGMLRKSLKGDSEASTTEG